VLAEAPSNVHGSDIQQLVKVIRELQGQLLAINSHCDRLAVKNLLYINERANHLGIIVDQKEVIHHRNLQIKDLKKALSLSELNLHNYRISLESEKEKVLRLQQGLQV